MSFVNYILDSLLFWVMILAVGLLPWLVTAYLLQLISNSLRQALARLLGGNGYIYITAPGVAVHELSHAFFCVVFRHKVTEMKLFSPQQDGTLGYVSHTYNAGSYYQRAGNFFIGTGPIWGGLVTLFLFSKLLLPSAMFPSSPSITDNISAFLGGFFSMTAWSCWTFYVWLYVALAIGSHITLSRPDLTGAKDGFLMLCGIILGCCLLFGWCGDWEASVMGWLRDFFFGQLPLISTVMCLLIIFMLLLKLIPKKGR